MLPPIDDTALHGVTFHMFDKKAEGTRRAPRERRTPARPSHILNNKYKLDKKWKLMSWQLNNSNFTELHDHAVQTARSNGSEKVTRGG